jgi:hypothetical protein
MRRTSLLAAAAPLAAVGLLAGAGSTSADTLPQLNSTTLSSTLHLTSGTRTTTTSTTGTSPGSGSASSSVISIPPLQTCVSCTSAQAGNGTAGGQATALELFGSNVAGGSSSGNNSSSGAVLALPSNPLLTAAILDWASSSSTSSGSSKSTSRAAVADLALAGGQVATVTILEGDSTATWTGSQTGTTSTGSAENNGAVVNVGQGALVLVLLHSDANSNGQGNAYVASINGNQILSSSQTGGIPITIPGVGTITLLAVNASGGTTSAAVGQVSGLLGQNGTQGTAFGSSGSGGKTSGGVLGISTGPPTPAPSSRQPTTASSSSGAGVPFTGAQLGIGGLMLLAAGGLAFGTGALLRRRRS